MDPLKAIAEKVEKGGNLEVPEAVRNALDKEIPPFEVMIHGLQAGLSIVGEKFKRGQCFIPEVLLAARAMKAGMEILKPLLAAKGTKPIAKVVLGTVKDDLHDLGKNIVRIMPLLLIFPAHYLSPLWPTCGEWRTSSWIVMMTRLGPALYWMVLQTTIFS